MAARLSARTQRAATAETPDHGGGEGCLRETSTRERLHSRRRRRWLTWARRPALKNIFHGEFRMRPTGACIARALPLSRIACGLRACGRQQEPGPAAPQQSAAANALQGQVDIVAWPGYIERGDTDPKYDWVKTFETDTGCKVNVKTAGTSDGMVSLMNGGGYDLVTASGGASLRLVRGGT